MANPNQDSRDGNGRYIRTTTTAERDAEAARLRSKGWTLEAIGEKLGMNHRSVQEAIGRALKEIVEEDARDVRRMLLSRLDAELDRLNGLEKAAHRVLRARHITVSNGRVITHPDTDEPMEDDGPVLQAIDRLVKIEDARRRNGERRAKLLGLDAPTRVDATVHEVTQQDLELQEMLRDAKAKVAAQEQQLRGGTDG